MIERLGNFTYVPTAVAQIISYSVAATQRHLENGIIKQQKKYTLFEFIPSPRPIFP
jgi:hypothetical protein